jgi:hypothetical protein
MKFFNFLIASLFAQNPWENMVNIDDPRSCIICNEQGSPSEVYKTCEFSGLGSKRFFRKRGLLVQFFDPNQEL